MKILKLGQRIVECNFCNSILGYETTDMYQTEIFTGPRESHSEYYLICPVCQNHITLEDRNAVRRTERE